MGQHLSWMSQTDMAVKMHECLQQRSRIIMQNISWCAALQHDHSVVSVNHDGTLGINHRCTGWSTLSALSRACCTCKKSWAIDYIMAHCWSVVLPWMHKQLLSLTVCKTILSYTYETLYQVTHTGCTSSTAVSTSQQCRVFQYHNTTHNGICAVDKQKKLMLDENFHATWLPVENAENHMKLKSGNSTVLNLALCSCVAEYKAVKHNVIQKVEFVLYHLFMHKVWYLLPAEDWRPAVLPMIIFCNVCSGSFATPCCVICWQTQDGAGVHLLAPKL